MATHMLLPLMPEKMNEFHEVIGCVGSTEQNTFDWGSVKEGTSVVKIALFPRVDQ